MTIRKKSGTSPHFYDRRINMRHKLFVYGSLKDPQVQLRIIGRTIEGISDSLIGYKKDKVFLEDIEYPALVAQVNGKIDGLILEVTDDEFVKLDAYETNAYKRITEKLKSGENAFVYILNDKKR